MDCSPPDSSVHGILQAKILEWVAIPFSRDFPNPGIKLMLPALQADSLLSDPYQTQAQKESNEVCICQGPCYSNKGYKNWDEWKIKSSEW